MFSIENHGSIMLVRPLTADVSEWLQENTDGQWFGGALAVEPRYVDDLVEGLEAEGFSQPDSLQEQFQAYYPGGVGEPS